MAKLGSPLQFEPKSDVPSPVLLAGKSQIGTNLSALKIDLARYDTPMNNAAASMLVTQELGNMVEKGTKAYFAVEEIKRGYEKSKAGEGWDTMNMDFDTAFTNARTVEDKQQVLNTFKGDVNTYKKGLGDWANRPDSLEYIADKNRQSYQRLKKAEASIATQQYNYSVGDAKGRIKNSEIAIATDPSADVNTEIQKQISSLVDLMNLGETDEKQHLLAVNNVAFRAYMSRAKFIGRKLGRENPSIRLEDMDRNEIFKKIDLQVSFDGNLEEGKLRPHYKDQILDEFFAGSTERMREAAAQDQAFEQSSKIFYREDIRKKKLEYKTMRIEGKLTQETHDDLMAYFDNNSQHAEMNEYNENYIKYKDASPIQTVLFNWTDQNGDIATALAEGTDTSLMGMYDEQANSFDLDAIEDLMRAKGITHEKTIDAVRAYYTNTQEVLSKGYYGGASAKLVIEGALMNMVDKDNVHAFYDNFGIPVDQRTTKGFDYKLYNDKTGSIIDNAKDEWNIIRKVEAGVIGAIQADIDATKGVQLVKDGKAIALSSDYDQMIDDKQVPLPTPFSATINENGDVVHWQARANTPKFRREFRTYVERLTKLVTHQQHPKEYWIQLHKNVAAKKDADKLANKQRTGNGKKLGLGVPKDD
jgi:hypothetical protein